MKMRATLMMMAATLAPLPLMAQDPAPTAPAVCAPAAEAPAVSALAHLPITSDLYAVIRGEEQFNSFVRRDFGRVEGAAVVISPGMAEVLQSALPLIRLSAMSAKAGRENLFSDIAANFPVAKVWDTVYDEADKEGIKCLTDFWRSTHLKPIYAAFSVTPGNEEWLRDELFTPFVKMIQDGPESNDEVHFEKLEYKGFRGTRLTVLPPKEGDDPEDEETQLRAALAGRNFCLLTRLVGNTMMVAVCEDPEELVLPSSPAESLAALPELRGPAANSPFFVQANLSVAATKAITEAVTQFCGGQADAWKRAFELYAKESPEQAEAMAAGARGVVSLFSDFARMMKAANEKTAASTLLRVWGGEEPLPRAYLAEQPARVGVALLENGQLHTLGEGEFPLMSVVKLHQACYVLHRMAELGLRPEDTLLIHYSELRQDTYSPMLQDHRDSVFRLSLRELLTYSLQLSDNNACDILFRHFGGPDELQRHMQSLGIDCKIGATEAEMHDTPARIHDNRSTPSATARLLALISEHRLGLPPAYAALLDELLSGCKTGTARIAAGLPPGATLLHKTGTGPCTPTQTCGVNDAAYIILPNGRRYILVIFCASSPLPLPQTEAILAEISARIAAE